MKRERSLPQESLAEFAAIERLPQAAPIPAVCSTAAHPLADRPLLPPYLTLDEQIIANGLV